MGPKPLAASVEQSSPSAPATPLGAQVGRLAAQPNPCEPSAPTEVRDGEDTPRGPLPLDFACVYEAEFDFVWRSLRLLGVDPNSVDDALQEVFSVVSRRLSEFEGSSSLRTWLFAILRRVAANQRRTVRRKHRPLGPIDDEVVSPLPTPQAQVEATQSIQLVQRFCDTLDAERRAVFVLALLEELPAPEVSQALGIPVNTVYSRVRHLREGLLRLLEKEGVSRG